MKVFLSWSGSRSKAVAELLSEWTRCVLQAIRPWISSKDIDRGSIWFGEISNQLGDTKVGIVCLTQENKLRPWILFEAGALAKGLSSARVCTFLIDLQPRDVEDPLAQFNHTLPEKSSVRALVQTLNGLLDESRLDERTLENVFETYWPSFETRFSAILIANPPVSQSPPRNPTDLLSEILDNTRQLGASMRRIEARVVPARRVGLLSGGLLDQPSADAVADARKTAIERLVGLGMDEERIVRVMADSGDQRAREEILEQIRSFSKPRGA